MLALPVGDHGGVIKRRNITKICVADVGQRIVPKHRVNRFRQFGTVRLVDAGGVDPSPVIAVFLRELKKVSQFAGYFCRKRRSVLSRQRQ